MWEVATTEEFDLWFAGLGEDEQAEVIAKVELLKLLGPRLGRPHADTLKDSKHSNMKELRADAKHRVLRIAFAFDPERLGRFAAWWQQIGDHSEAILQESNCQSRRPFR